MARAGHGSKLRNALDRHQGKDQKLEREKKLAREAEKKKREKQRREEEDRELAAAEEELEAAGGIAFAAADADDINLGVDEQDDDAWETDEEEDEDDDEDEEDFATGFMDMDSSESESDDEVDEAPTATSLLRAKLQPNGKTPSGLADEQQPQDDSDAPSSIPLSDLASDDENPNLDNANDDAMDNDDIIPHQRLTINNTSALLRAHASIALPVSTLPFSAHQSVISAAATDVPDPNDDLGRELAFYSQALAAAREGRRALLAEGAPFSRPVDYFAEMVKSDEHMGKVKGKLVEAAAGKKAAAEARKLRDAKKFGKQVQQERLKERAKEKKDAIEKVGVLRRKRKGAGLEVGEGGREEVDFDVAVDREIGAEERKKRKRDARGDAEGRNAKRAKKDQKFGFGGKKKFKKSGDAASSGDMRGFSTKKMKGKQQRPGKSRRAKMK